MARYPKCSVPLCEEPVMVRITEWTKDGKKKTRGLCAKHADEYYNDEFNRKRWRHQRRTR